MSGPASPANYTPKTYEEWTQTPQATEYNTQVAKINSMISKRLITAIVLGALSFVAFFFCATMMLSLALASMQCVPLSTGFFALVNAAQIIFPYSLLGGVVTALVLLSIPISVPLAPIDLSTKERFDAVVSKFVKLENRLTAKSFQAPIRNPQNRWTKFICKWRRETPLRRLDKLIELEIFPQAFSQDYENTQREQQKLLDANQRASYFHQIDKLSDLSQQLATLQTTWAQHFPARVAVLA